MRRASGAEACVKGNVCGCDRGWSGRQAVVCLTRSNTYVPSATTRGSVFTLRPASQLGLFRPSAAGVKKGRERSNKRVWRLKRKISQIASCFHCFNYLLYGQGTVYWYNLTGNVRETSTVDPSPLPFAILIYLFIQPHIFYLLHFP